MRFFRLVRPLKSLTHFRTLRLVIDTFIASRVSIATVGTCPDRRDRRRDRRRERSSADSCRRPPALYRGSPLCPPGLEHQSLGGREHPCALRSLHAWRAAIVTFVAHPRAPTPPALHVAALLLPSRSIGSASSARGP